MPSSLPTALAASAAENIPIATSERRAALCRMLEGQLPRQGIFHSAPVLSLTDILIELKTACQPSIPFDGTSTLPIINPQSDLAANNSLLE